MKILIPKIIHFCWFGRSSRPRSVERCIASWRKYMPDYLIMKWDENNFNIQSSQFSTEAYQARKYAFVSDVARGHALYRHGGIYLDTDVEVLKPFDDLLSYRSFWGFESGNFIATSTIGAVPQHETIKSYIEWYRMHHFLQKDGSPKVITRLWQEQGLILSNKQQVIGDANLFLPQIYFSPYDYTVGNTALSNNSYAIHHYAKTWLGPWAKIKGYIKKTIAKMGAQQAIIFLQKIFSRF